MKRVTVALTVGVFGLGVGPSWGHHSPTMFDHDNEVTFEGVVKEFQYTNPHSWLLVDVTNDDGSVTTWGFEAEGPTRLRLAGIRKADLPPGTKLTITGNPMKDGRPGAAWITATTEDGREINPRRPLEGFSVPD